MYRSYVVAVLLSTAAILSGQTPDFTPPTPLFGAVLSGNGAEAKRLIQSGANPNEGRFVGAPPLLFSLVLGNTEIARTLIDGGADLTATDPSGSTALMWAATSEIADTTIVELLLSKGVKIDAVNAAGESALTWAMRRGDTPVVRMLRKHGASERTMIQDSVQRAVNLLQKSGPEFLKVSGCTSCHQQSLPDMVYAMARERGIQVDPAVSEKQVKSAIAMYKPFREQMMQGKQNLPDPGISVSYALIGLGAAAYKADETTAAMAHLVSVQQDPDGSFRCLPGRPPIESSKVSATALSIRALQLYGSDVEQKIANGRNWLRSATANTTEERAMKLLGLAWAKADAKDLQNAAKPLLADQRVEGGWGQLPNLESDAYATGQALLALHTAGQMTVSDDVYLRGAGYLLRTQRQDGSWLVRTRSFPFQPLKESGFPHGRDQWISAAGSSWAAMALSMALPPTATQVTQRF